MKVKSGVATDSMAEVIPQIADHEIIRSIGEGGYGKVWLAKSIIGGYHAVKVVERKRFSEEPDYLREFRGICKFEPISRSHSGLVAILHVGQNENPQYFYYVMELADDVHNGHTITPEAYLARTLKDEIASYPRLALNRKLQIAWSLTSALGYIHEQGLIHRDIKPSNIIFVKGVPKIADIGLITEAGPNVSAGGTPYYMPPEGPGAPTGDIYSLGKVFYELFMGLPPKQYPELPDKAEEFTTVPELLQANNLILKACANDPRRRFQSTKELSQALQAFGGTVQKAQPGNGQTDTASPEPTQPPTTDASSSKAIGPEKSASARQVRPVANGGRGLKKPWSRRAMLAAAAPVALVGPFVLGREFPSEKHQAYVRKLETEAGNLRAGQSLQEKFDKWQTLYDVADDKLASFMGYVGTRWPKTKFLIYSRGTDRNWVSAKFRGDWIEAIEKRFEALKGRLVPIVIEKQGNWQRATFQNPATGKQMESQVTAMLALNEADPKRTDAPVIVLMDTPAARGVYDDENKDTGRTNAEVLRPYLENLRTKENLRVSIHIEPVSIDSSKRSWPGEERVLGHEPDLIIIHRSSFFHPVNALIGLGYPVYDALDKLIGWDPK